MRVNPTRINARCILATGLCLWLGLDAGAQDASTKVTKVASVPATSTNRPLFRLKPRITEADRKKAAEEANRAENAVQSLAGPQPAIVLSAATNATDNPLARFWNDPEFLKNFAGSYGFHPDIEPKITTTNEMAIYRELAQVLRDNPEQAAQMLSTNVTATNSAVFDFTYGTVLFQLGKNDQAIKAYEDALAKFPNFQRATKNLGFALVKSGRYVDALKPLARTIEIGAGDANTYGLLAYCYLNQEKYLAAEDAYRNALLLMPDNKDWRLGLIKSQISTGRYVEADKLLQEMIGANPDNDALWELQANLYMQMERPAKAAMNFEILRRMGKADIKTLMLLGDIYMTQDAREVALDVYMEAIAKDGATDLSRSLRAADILVRSGAWEEGGKLLKEIRRVHAAKISPEEDMKVLKLDSRIAMATGEGGLAANVLTKIIEKNPMDGEALLLLGDQLVRSGEKEKAMFRYELAAKIPEFEADALVKQAQLKVSERKHAEAIELLRKALKLKDRENVKHYLESVERIARSAGS